MQRCKRTRPLPYDEALDGFDVIGLGRVVQRVIEVEGADALGCDSRSRKTYARM